MNREELIPRPQLLTDLNQHLWNAEAFAASSDVPGPDIQQLGPQGESMAQSIRRLASGQCTMMSLRYLRSIIAALSQPAEPVKGGDLLSAFDEACANMSGSVDAILEHFSEHGKILGDGEWRLREIFKHASEANAEFQKVVQMAKEPTPPAPPAGEQGDEAETAIAEERERTLKPARRLGVKATPIGIRVKVTGGVYKGRTGILTSNDSYFVTVKPDAEGVGGLNPSGEMVVGASEFVPAPPPALASQPPAPWPDTLKTCGEISCDECNERYLKAMGEIAELQSQLDIEERQAMSDLKRIEDYQEAVARLCLETGGNGDYGIGEELDDDVPMKCKSIQDRFAELQAKVAELDSLRNFFKITENKEPKFVVGHAILAIEDLQEENAELKRRLLSAAGDDLCRLTQEEIKAYSSGAVQIPPKEEFIASCERFHQQIAEGPGVLTNCLTLAQLIAENQQLQSDLALMESEKNRLARKIDVAMHGEENAARQASLCDLVPLANQLRMKRVELQAKVERLEHYQAALKTALESRLPEMAVHSGDLLHNACCAIDSLKEQLAAAEARRIVEGK